MIASLLTGIFWLFATLNPYWKKYDFGGEFPVVILLTFLNLFLVILAFRKLRSRFNLGDIFLGIFLLAITISFIFSQAWGIGLSEYLTFSGAVLTYFILSRTPKLNTQTLYTIIKIGTLAAIAVGFYFYLTAPEPRMFGPFLDLDLKSMRWPNAFALFLLLTWPIFLIRRSPSLFSFLFSLFSLSLTFSALLLTFSRGALIAFAGQIFILAIFQIKYITKRTLFTAATIAALTLLIFTTANHLRQAETIQVAERLNFENNEQLTSKNERQEFWQGSIQLISQNPFFGSGPFTFRYAYNPIQPSLLATSDHPHNLFLKIAVENGLIAAASLLLFFLYLATRTLQTLFTKHPENRCEIILLSIAILGALAHNLIDYNLNFLANLLPLFIYLAILNRINQPATKPANYTLFLLFSFFFFLFAFFSHLSPQKFYPINYHLSLADQAIQNQDYPQTIQLIDQHLKTNTLDSQAYYLRAVAKTNLNQDPLTDFERALTLNPKNQFIYHFSYLQTETDPAKLQTQIPKTAALLQDYFFYVQENIHYTAQTNNVADAALTIDLLTGPLRSYLPAEQRQSLIEGKAQMLKDAEEWREGS
ncbi:O-antigen ligase family protein [Candidatus Gracilibacteria bacterium]|nr:O-antigen ligase family protein [Candidatus Gracilibacteria bacterium]